MDIRDRVCDTLKPLGVDVVQQGSFPDEELPAKVITYWVVASPDTRHYNGRIAMTIPKIQIAFYSNDPSELLTLPDQISNMLLAAGFHRDGNWRDAAYEKSPGHYGKMTDFNYLERGENFD